MNPAEPPRPTETAPAAPAAPAPPAPPAADRELRASVVIPVRGGLDRLADTLRAVAAQDLPWEAFEVIVVDDGTPTEQGSVDQVAREAVSGERLALRVLAQKPAGPAAARNRGIDAARAPVVALLDADVLPRPDWLRNGLAPFETPGPPAAVEGQTVVEPATERTPFTHQTDNRDGGRYPTCNLFVDKRWLDARGVRFDERYTVPFREDSDFAFQVLASCGEIRWWPAAEVVHPPVGRGWTTPLKLAQRYQMDALLKRRFPERYAGLDRRCGAAHVRQTFYGLLLYGQCAVFLFSLLRWRDPGEQGAFGFETVLATLFWLNVVAVLAGGCPTRRALRHLPATALVALLVPWPWAAARLLGAWRFRRVHPFEPRTVRANALFGQRSADSGE